MKPKNAYDCRTWDTIRHAITPFSVPFGFLVKQSGSQPHERPGHQGIAPHHFGRGPY